MSDEQFTPALVAKLQAGKTDELLQRLQEFANKNFKRHYTLGELALALNVSRHHLSHRLRAV